MGDPAVAFLAVLLIVGVVLLAVGAIAFFGVRAVLHPATRRTRRRLAQSLIVVGIFSLGFHLGLAVSGTGINWLSLVVAIGLIWTGLVTLRNLKQDGPHRTAQ